MTHEIRCLVTDPDTAARLRAAHVSTTAVALHGAWSAVPFELRCFEYPDEPGAGEYDRRDVPEASLRAVTAMSAHGRFAYVQTEFWGGDGGQGAFVCEAGELVLPPVWSVGTGPVDAALAVLGVPAPESVLHDRFDLLGLGRFRRNRDLEDR